ncbi:MAG TPA: acyl-CoA mutase large subunit family protein [Gammaproteobacteria bacterium]|nr:acyl-CoA mutase large subunit family protein [Gammaproteobacteria bacterium]
MSRQPAQLPLPGFDKARAEWRRAYSEQLPEESRIFNRSGIELAPLYTPEHFSDKRYMDALGFPGYGPMTRGIYPSMHRGRAWSQRQLVGLGLPEDYNLRLKRILASGGTAVSLIPCNSVYRGLDADRVDPLLLGTCGAVVNTVDDMDACFADVDIDEFSTAMNDPLPFTLLALLLAVAKRRGISWTKVTGTSNQSDYISHFVANHMFFRIALPGSRRILLDHIEFCNRQLPGWNPLSVVGQHMQQAGATPSEAMAFTLCTAIQYAEDCIARGMDPEEFLPRFTFFFDISISFFEEIAKFRAGRRIWARVVRERFGARNPRAARFKFHAQTSGVDLTRQQPLNNIARVTIQAMAGILGGLQSLHTDAYDEVLSVPTEHAARIAVCTQNILREEARLSDVIDPLGGSYYLERLTDEMEALIESIIAKVDAAGGMYLAVESGLVQTLIGESAIRFQTSVDSGEHIIVGVNRYRLDDDSEVRVPLKRPPPEKIEAQLEALARYKRGRDNEAVRRTLDDLARSAVSEKDNVYAAVVEAVFSGATHGEVVATLRREMGDGEPFIVP